MASAAAAALLHQPAVASSSRRPRALLGMLLGRRGLAAGADGGTVQVTSRQARRQQWLKERGAKAAVAAESAAPAGKEAAGATAAAPATAGEGGTSTALKAGAGVVLLGGGYLAYQTAASDGAVEDTPVIGAAYGWVYDTVFKPFVNPSREKLLPDWHNIPNVPPDAPCPPTLVLDLEDTLVHATWDPKYGWRYAKRPGVDRFLQELSKYYEIVLFSPSNYGVVEQITWTLDKEGLIMHRLYRDATRFHQGKHVKDLSKLNRDLRKVVIVDDDPDAFQFQPENGIRIRPFLNPKDKADRSLDKLRRFLVAVVMEGRADDIPAVLRQFRGLDADQLGDAYEQRLRQAKQREAEKHMKGLGGLLRSQKAFQGVANPFATSASAAASSEQPRGLSAKDIVGGAPEEPAKAAVAAARERLLPPELQPHQQSAPPPAGPVKKGKLWERYQNYLKEAEEDQRRKLELFEKRQQQREKEARRAALEQQAQAAEGR